MKNPFAIIQDQANISMIPPTVRSKPYTSDNPCEEQNCFKVNFPLKVRTCRSALPLCIQPDQANKRKNTLSPCRPECHWRAGRNVQDWKDQQSLSSTHAHLQDKWYLFLQLCHLGPLDGIGSRQQDSHFTQTWSGSSLMSMAEGISSISIFLFRYLDVMWICANSECL